MNPRAALSTGISKTFEWDQAETARAWALREASMLVERNDRGWYCSPWERHNASMALSEALAAFIVADLG